MLNEKPIHFYFVTLFPETIRPWLTSSILGKAHQAGLFHFELLQLRDFASDRHKTVDDVAYGGGGGMVLKIEPLVKAVEAILKNAGRESVKIIYPSPAGHPLTHRLVSDLAKGKTRNFIFICGHYEGIDQRFIDHWVDLEISVGDFVITGGELPAALMVDAMIRQLDGALGGEAAHVKESFALRHASGTLLEYPHYTRPAEFRGLQVPKILLTGDHKRIEAWREKEALHRTQTRRPDLLS